MKYCLYLMLMTGLLFSFCANNNTQPSSLETKILVKETIPSEPESDILVTHPEHHFPYKLHSPQQTFKMPNKLEEISGLSLSPDGKHLLAIQDEEGDIFKVNLSSGEVEEEIDFGKDGDYEGIAVSGSTTYITKSNGTIYEVKNTGKKNQETSTHKTALKGRNDVEGLCYQPATNSLLVACKGIPTMGETTEEAAMRKSIYRFDLSTKKLIERPVYQIQLSDVQKFLNSAAYHPNMKKLRSYLEDSNRFKFSPSGIAIHPKTGHLYILSSSKKMLLLLNTKGEIIYLAKLDKKIHRQPEGIAFSADGTLYIANEGKGGHGKIFVYK